MAKGQDPFEKFKAATLSGGPSIKEAISSDAKPAKASKPAVSPETNAAPSPAPSTQIEQFASNKQEVKEKAAVKLEQVSFFLDKDLKKAVGLLKYELDVQLKDLYEEAIRDLLKKYHKL